MSMNFSSDGLPLKVKVQDYVQRKIDSAIGPFEDFVKAVDIRIVDVNGPKRRHRPTLPGGCGYER